MIKAITSRVRKIYPRFFSEHLKHRLESLVIFFALFGFVIHLLLIMLGEWGVYDISLGKQSLLDDPISAIYTPFSFILVFEVFLLVYYIPSSFATAIGKQYEIISLIILRRIFKDIAKVDNDVANWNDADHYALMADMVGVLLIFFFIYLFYKINRDKPSFPITAKLHRFITIKKMIAILLLPVLLVLSTYSFGAWVAEIWGIYNGNTLSLSNINNIFYIDFFTILILVDVCLLIISLNYTDRYSLLIRNAGFVVSTVLIRLSFSIDGWQNTMVIVVGVAFGVLIFGLYNLLASQEKEIQDHPQLEKDNLEA